MDICDIITDKHWSCITFIQFCEWESYQVLRNRLLMFFLLHFSRCDTGNCYILSKLTLQYVLQFF